MFGVITWKETDTVSSVTLQLEELARLREILLSTCIDLVISILF